MSKNTVPLIASGQAIPAGVGKVTGIIVNAHSSGVIKLIDSPNSVTGRILFGGNNGYTLPTGSSFIPLTSGEYEGVEYYEGVFFQLVSGTADIQLIFKPTS